MITFTLQLLTFTSQLIWIHSAFDQNSSSKAIDFNGTLRREKKQTDGNEVSIFVCALIPAVDEFTFPIYASKYAELIKEIVNSSANIASQQFRINVIAKIYAVNYDQLCRPYNRMFECAATTCERLRNDNLVKWCIILGPPCNPFMPERSSNRVVSYVRRQTLDLTIVASTMNLFPRSGMGRFLNLTPEAGLFGDRDQPTLMHVDGTLHRLGILLRYLFAVHFRYRHVTLLSMAPSGSGQLTYCENLFYFLATQVGSAYNPKIMFTFDKYSYDAMENQAEHLDLLSAAAWNNNKFTTRICVLCGSVVGVRALLREIQRDQDKTGIEYGIFVLIRERQLGDFYITQIATPMFVYVKFLIPDPIHDPSCNFSRSDLEPFMKNDSYSMENLERLYALNEVFDRTICAVQCYMQYVAKLGTSHENISNYFANNYGGTSLRVRADHGLAVEWTPKLSLISVNPSGIKDTVLTIGFKRVPSGLENNVTNHSALLWYGKDKWLSDAPFICNGKARFFPCPTLVSEGITDHQKALIGLSIILAVLMVATLAFVLTRKLRKNDRYLRTRYLKDLDTDIRSRGTADKAIVYGTFKKESHLLFLVNNQLSKDDKHLPNWALRDLDVLSVVSDNNPATIVPLVGYVQFGPICRLMYRVGTAMSLKELMKRVHLTTDIKYTFARDLAASLNSVHQSRVGVHGDLRSSYFMVDNRFILRLMLITLPSAKMARKTADKPYAKWLWTAPELLNSTHAKPTQSSDVYSMGIIFHEIAYQRGTFFREDIQGMKHERPVVDKDFAFRPDSRSDKSSLLQEDESCAEIILEKVKFGKLRPSMPIAFPENAELLKTMKPLNTIMQNCWHQLPKSRPTADQVQKELQSFMKANHMVFGLTESNRLSRINKEMLLALRETKADHMDDRDRGIKYLMHMMPTSFSYEFIRYDRVQRRPIFCPNVTIYFNDLVRFSMINIAPGDAITALDQLFNIYDKTVSLYHVTPLHRVGSSLLLASGVPEPYDGHAYEIALAALHIRLLAKSHDAKLALKAGIHSGSVMCGMAGKTIQQFGLFGDTVNTASRMSTTCTTDDEIQISTSTFDLLATDARFELSQGTPREIKGKGQMTTYRLLNFKGGNVQDVYAVRLDNQAPPQKTDEYQDRNLDTGPEISHVPNKTAAIVKPAKTTHSQAPKKTASVFKIEKSTHGHVPKKTASRSKIAKSTFSHVPKKTTSVLKGPKTK